MKQKKNRINGFFSILLSIVLVLSCFSKQTKIELDIMKNTDILFEAVKSGDVKRVAAILKEKPLLDIQNRQGQTPLMYAVYKKIMQ